MSRPANQYFLVICVLVSLPMVSPVQPFTTIAPFVFVLCVSAAREAFEDYNRHVADCALNTRRAETLHRNHTQWQDIKVGDIVCVYRNEPVPADLVLLLTSHTSHECYVETSSIDGETSLKRKTVPQVVNSANVVSKADLVALIGSVTCELPNNRLDSFQGSLEIHSHSAPTNTNTNANNTDTTRNTDTNTTTSSSSNKSPLCLSNLLLRGCQLRNTSWVCGVVVATGHETKLLRNAMQLSQQVKQSQAECMMHSMLKLTVVLQLCFLLSCCVAHKTFASSHASQAWYISDDTSPALSTFLVTMTYVVLFNVMVPISLYVSLEVVRIFQSQFINCDAGMFDRERNISAVAKTAALNEELGCVDVVLSDKTGTLTTNSMTLRKICVEEKILDVPSEQAIVDCDLMMTLLCICNTVQCCLDINDQCADSISTATTTTKPTTTTATTTATTNHTSSISSTTNPVTTKTPTTIVTTTDKSTDKTNTNTNNTDTTSSTSTTTTTTTTAPISSKVVDYEAESPDELALVRGAMVCGWRLVSRSQSRVGIFTQKLGYVSFEILQVLGFTSERRRMSVLVRFPNHVMGGGIKLLTKGADTVMHTMLSSHEQHVTFALTSIDDFARDGLRTLCCAYADIPEERAGQWCVAYQKAKCDGNLEKVMQLQNQIESDLHLLGATAIEDNLQDKTAHTIQQLKAAGIRVWVLTGDKCETAVSVAVASGLATRGSCIKAVSTKTRDGKLVLHVSDMPQGLAQSFASPKPLPCSTLLLDGQEMERIWNILPLREELVHLCFSVESVVVCRALPSQKAQIVEALRTYTWATTLAIGDGGNDVPMIKKAHIGVGIRGHEGSQAALSSDFAIAQFCHLERLLLVHGRWNLRRVSILILYSFYKNLALAGLQLQFSVCNAFSGQTFYSGALQSTFNVLWTGLPVILFAVFDKDVDANTTLLQPQIYQCRVPFDYAAFRQWILRAVWHSLVCFVPFVASGVSSLAAHAQSHWLTSSGSYIGLVAVVTVNLALQTRTWTAISVMVSVGSVLSVFPFMFVFAAPQSFAPELAGVAPNLFSSVSFWVCLLLCVGLALILDIVLELQNTTRLNASSRNRIRFSSLASMASTTTID